MGIQDMTLGILTDANFSATFMSIIMSLLSWELGGNKFPHLFIIVVTSSAAIMGPWKFHQFIALSFSFLSASQNNNM
jgi:hypothetical protein